jgi:hypothetical protein
MVDERCPRDGWGLLRQPKEDRITDKIIELMYKCPKCNRAYSTIYESISIQGEKLFDKIKIRFRNNSNTSELITHSIFFKK